MLFGRTFFFRKMTMRLLLSPSSSRPPDDDRVLLLRYFPRERRTHRFVVFFFFVVVLENADCSCEQKATLFSATRHSSHSSSHSTSSRRNTRSYSTCALEENTFQRNERLLVPVLSSRRGLFARTSYLPTNDDRFIVWCAFLVFSRVGFSLAENPLPSVFEINFFRFW